MFAPLEIGEIDPLETSTRRKLLFYLLTQFLRRDDYHTIPVEFVSCNCVAFCLRSLREVYA
jgi:hypothetical protein